MQHHKISRGLPAFKFCSLIFRNYNWYFFLQAEESKRNTIDSARRLAEDYRPLKHEVDLMRTELLGLEKLPELPNEEKEKMSALGLGILEKPKPMLEGPHGKFEKSLF